MALHAQRQASGQHKKTRVLVVDDSALIRKLLANVLGRSADIEVVDCAVDANDARQKIKQYNPDVVTLDIEMPGMDGLTFLEKVMKLRPTPVVMCSTLTQRGAEATLKALSIGAVDFVPKPTVDVKEQLDAYGEELISKVLAAAQVKFGSRAVPQVANTEVLNVSRKRRVPKLVAIGSSTGGTIALEAILRRLPKDAPPVVIAQHIPSGFSDAFARRVNEYTQVEVREACDGDEVLPGLVLIAPGGYHLTVVNVRGKLLCRLDDGPKVNRHKPSVDVLFNSVCQLTRKDIVGVILTGMGSDGAEGLKAMFDIGYDTIAQDEKSSMVWGMPKRAVELGAASQVVSLDDMAAQILERAY